MNRSSLANRNSTGSNLILTLCVVLLKEGYTYPLFPTFFLISPVVKFFQLFPYPDWWYGLARYFLNKKLFEQVWSGCEFFANFALSWRSLWGIVLPVKKITRLPVFNIQTVIGIEPFLHFLCIAYTSLRNAMSDFLKRDIYWDSSGWMGNGYKTKHWNTLTSFAWQTEFLKFWKILILDQIIV